MRAYPLLIILLLVSCSTKTPVQEETSTLSPPKLSLQTTPSPPTEFKKIQLTISQIHLHGENGWQTLTQNAKRIDTSQEQTLYETLLTPGNHDRVKLILTQVQGTKKTRTQPFYLPGHEVNIPLDLTAQAGHTYTVQLTFQHELHPTRENQYVYTPRLQVTVKDQGEVIHQYELGMDEQGNVEKNAHIRTDTEFRIVNDKIRIVHPLLQDSSAGINLYLQSLHSEVASEKKQTPAYAILKEIRLQNNNTVTVYKGEQELLLDANYVQEIASEQVPADSYTHVKLYFKDAGRDAERVIELATPILTSSANLTTYEDKTLNVLIRIPIEEKNNLYALQEPQISTTLEKGIHTDMDHTGQRLYIPHADLATIREAEQQGLFK